MGTRGSHGTGGFTLLELATVLMLLAVATSAFAPSAARWADRAAVRAAREAAVGLAARVRAEAAASGEAGLGLSPAGDSLWVEAGGRTVAVLHVGREHGVDLGPEGAPDRVLAFGFLGLGRAASRTLTFRRGDHAAAVTVSGYGRVRRW